MQFRRSTLLVNCEYMKQIGIFFVFALILLIASTNASHIMGNDIENPLRADSEHVPLANSDNEDGASNLPVAGNRAWTVPRGQFDVGIAIYSLIFQLMTFPDQNNPISFVISAILIMSLIICVQLYFGFYISVQKRSGADFLTSLLPEFKYTQVDFGNDGERVPYARWASGPFSWITQILSLFPVEEEVCLEIEPYFSDKTILNLIFIVQLMYYFGYFDCNWNNIDAKLFDWNRNNVMAKTKTD